VQVQDVSESTAAVSLQGPSARAILQIAAERDLSALKYFRLTSATIRGIPVHDLAHRLYGGFGVRGLG